LLNARWKQLLSFYQLHPDDGKKLIAVGESQTGRDAGRSDPRAWTMLANQLMNLDEVLNK